MKRRKNKGINSGYAEVGGSRLYYETAGQGYPLVFVHGGLADSRVWDGQFSSFADHFKVIRYDARGFGKSERPKNPFYPFQDLKALLDYLDVKKAFLLGLSNGGAISIDFTLEYPERVKALILAGPSVHGFSYSDEFLLKGLELFTVALKKGAEQATKILFEDPFWDYALPSLRNIKARNKMRIMAREFFQAFCWDPNLMKAAAPPAIERISGINVPTLLIAGGDDHQENINAVEKLESEIRGAERVNLAGACHMMNLEYPQKFNMVVHKFLKKAVTS
jgi:3-oxoadipate enol-lactonase